MAPKLSRNTRAAFSFLSRREEGFTLIEVLVAAMVLVVGLLAMLGMLDVASHTTRTNRVRQQATNLGRELVEDVRALSYTQLATPTSIATALVPQVSPGATLTGSTLSITRSGYTFNVAFTGCSLDDPSDGYGDHSAPPASGGSWCPDVAASGTSDSNPDDDKRISVTVTPTNTGGVTRTYPVQQTVLIYARSVNGPAVSCLTTAGSGCPGTNQVISNATVTSLTFNVTTTSLPFEMQWLVNGNPPGSQDPSGANGTYTPSSTTSSFTWRLPQADGIYSISALSLDSNGNSGTRSTLQITVNRHQVIPPATFNAGFDQQINNGTGGVDIQWVPSIDQDVLYYNVYHQIASAAPVLACSHVTGTSCTDTSAVTTAISPSWGSSTTCTNPPQSSNPTNVYYVVGVDTDPVSGQPRESASTSTAVDANRCDHPPSGATGLAGSTSGGAVNLTWSAPGSPVDPDGPSNGDTIVAWRLYRWPLSQGSTPQVTLANRLQLVGAGSGSPFVTSATDAGPNPGGSYYCVTAVDAHLNESPCSTPWHP